LFGKIPAAFIGLVDFYMVFLYNIVIQFMPRRDIMEQQNLRRIAERTVGAFRGHISENGIEPKDVAAYFERCATLYINYTIMDKVVTMTGLKPRIL